ncbi:MAG: response regulator [Lachnospiraceae bacterium]|nr:response regulator [Lachnospiraceae bacterium]MDD3659633.1 response regulator [Lachnospiraceae bacterium]
MNRPKLLIVDDEAKIRNGIYTYISHNAAWLGEIYQAENGEEALKIIYKYEPDMMLLDVQMPIKDGFDVMEEAVKSGVCPKTIILTGHDEFKYAQKALRLGAVDYILKPCRPGDIVQKMKEILSITEVVEPDTDQDKEDVNPIIDAAKKYIMDHYDQTLSLAEVADKVKVTPPYLSTLFTRYENCGFIDYLNQFRVERAKMFLHDYGLKTYEVAYKVGFQDEKYFSRVFKRITGKSPSEYRKIN